VEAEERTALLTALEQLPDSTREIVTLYYREGRSVDQVAGLLGMRPVAVKKRLERARAALRADMLERFGEVVQRTAPTAAFVGAVTSALVIAAPANAAAAGAVKAAQATKTFGLWKVIGAALPGAALGLLLGLSGIVFGTGLGLRKARDDEERRALVRLAVSSTANVLVFLTAVVVAGVLTSPVLLVASYLVAMIWFYYLYRVRLVRIVERRWRAEEAEDPSSAARHQRERTQQAHWIPRRRSGCRGGCCIGGATDDQRMTCSASPNLTVADEVGRPAVQVHLGRVTNPANSFDDCVRGRKPLVLARRRR
jgi:Ca2+/Na+ antiporter